MEIMAGPQALPDSGANSDPEDISNPTSEAIADPEAFRQGLEIYRKAIEEQLNNRESPSKIGKLYDWFCDHVQNLDMAVSLIPDALAIHGVKAKASDLIC